jgi:hypothetical protein
MNIAPAGWRVAAIGSCHVVTCRRARLDEVEHFSQLLPSGGSLGAQPRRPTRAVPMTSPPSTICQAIGQACARDASSHLPSDGPLSAFRSTERRGRRILRAPKGSYWGLQLVQMHRIRLLSDRRCLLEGAVVILAGMARRAPSPSPKPVLRIFRSEADQEWFAVTQRPSALPSALAPWFPADEQEMPVLANPLERDRVQQIIDADGFYLFRSRDTTSDRPAN